MKYTYCILVCLTALFLNSFTVSAQTIEMIKGSWQLEKIELTKGPISSGSKVNQTLKPDDLINDPLMSNPIIKFSISEDLEKITFEIINDKELDVEIKFEDNRLFFINNTININYQYIFIENHNNTVVLSSSELFYNEAEVPVSALYKLYYKKILE